MRTTCDTTSRPIIRAGAGSARVAGSTIRRARTARDWTRARRLLLDHAAWIEAETGISMLDAQPDLAAELSDPCRAYGSNRSVLLVADDGDEIRGVVAIRHHDDGSAELKRMYVEPSARGQGHARRLVDGAIRYAERWEATHVWLETLPGVMDRAIAMYRAHGFRQVAAAPHIDIDAAILMSRALDGGERR